MSGGKKIDDHKFFAGGKSEKSVLPMGVHTKQEKDHEESGHLATYEDTTEDIHAKQMVNKKKIHGHAQPSQKRN